MAKGKIYGSTEELIAGVSATTGVSEADVRKVLRASFESTKNYILQELGEAAGMKKSAGKKLSAATIDKLAGGPGLLGQLAKLNQDELRTKLAGAVNS